MESERVKKIKKKYGEDAFKRFGELGGSPILLKYAEKQREKLSKKRR